MNPQLWPVLSPAPPPPLLSADSIQGVLTRRPTAHLGPPIPCPASYLLLLRRATGSQQMEAPGQTGAEHAELDGLSLSREEIGTDHLITVAAISVFSLPPGMPTIPSHFSQIVISRTQQLTQLDVLRKKELQQKGLSPASRCIRR